MEKKMKKVSYKMHLKIKNREAKNIKRKIFRIKFNRSILLDYDAKFGMFVK